ncbi:hypothetical protein Tco_0787468 [Tanacetum coccineum]
MLEDFSSNDNATYSASAEDIAVQFCFFDIQLTSLSHNGTVFFQKVLFSSIKASGYDQRLKNAVSSNPDPLDTSSLHVNGTFSNALDIRKFDSSSYRLWSWLNHTKLSLEGRPYFLDGFWINEPCWLSNIKPPTSVDHYEIAVFTSI